MKTVLVVPGLDNPVTAQDLGLVVDQRDEIDYKCFLLLRKLLRRDFDVALHKEAHELVALREKLSDRILELAMGG
jgi:hypothetical protein